MLDHGLNFGPVPLKTIFMFSPILSIVRTNYFSVIEQSIAVHEHPNRFLHKQSLKKGAEHQKRREEDRVANFHFPKDKTQW